jgi:predicted RNA-binding protein with RPS1 domain
MVMQSRTSLLCWLLFCRAVTGFVSFTDMSRPWSTARSVVRAAQDDVVLYSEEEESPQRDYEKEEEQNAPWKKNARWNSLSPKVKLRIMQEAQQKAVENKQKRESSQDKKRRTYSNCFFAKKTCVCVCVCVCVFLSSLSHSFFISLFYIGMLMFFKKSLQQKERASRVKRDIAFSERTPLSELKPGMQVSGKVISNTNFGSYVDIGTECDGLLHVSQMTRDFFVEHPRQMVQPGDDVTVFIASTNPQLKKLHLTMLPNVDSVDDEDDDEERISLQDVSVDDELWGEIKRVTAFGAYVELGAVVDGFLHFMDHPQFGVNPGAPPSDFMRVGDRIRVWVSDVDMEKSRIKLTANRPAHLPGPRRDIY